MGQRIGVAYMIDEQYKEKSHDEDHEPEIDQPASRMSRSSRNARAAKETDGTPQTKVKTVLRSVNAALVRYFSFMLDVLKSPVQAAEENDRSYFKYSVISMTLLAVFFSLGNFYQLLSGRGRVLGFGVSVSFMEVFLVVFLYCMIFMFWNIAAIWAASRFWLKNKLSFAETATKYGSLLVPFIIPAALWMVCAILNITTMTVILSILMFLGTVFGTFFMIQSIYGKSERTRTDLMYCVFAVLLAELVYAGVTWKFMVGYLLSSLVPV